MISTSESNSASSSSTSSKRKCEVFVDVPIYPNPDVEPAHHKKRKGKERAQDLSDGGVAIVVFNASTASTPSSSSTSAANTCDHCEIELKTRWRGSNGELFCDDCGLFHAKHNTLRPLVNCASCSAKTSKLWWEVGLDPRRIYCNSCKEFLLSAQASKHAAQLRPDDLATRTPITPGPVCVDCNAKETRFWWGLKDQHARYCEMCANKKLKQGVKGLIACVPNKDIHPVHSRPSASPEKSKARPFNNAHSPRPVSPTKHESPKKTTPSVASSTSVLSRSLLLGEWSPHKRSRSAFPTESRSTKDASIVSTSTSVETSQPSNEKEKVSSSAKTSSKSLNQLLHKPSRSLLLASARKNALSSLDPPKVPNPLPMPTISSAKAVSVQPSAPIAATTENRTAHKSDIFGVFKLPDQIMVPKIKAPRKPSYPPVGTGSHTSLKARMAPKGGRRPSDAREIRSNSVLSPSVASEGVVAASSLGDSPIGETSPKANEGSLVAGSIEDVESESGSHLSEDSSTGRTPLHPKPAESVTPKFRLKASGTASSKSFYASSSTKSKSALSSVPNNAGRSPTTPTPTKPIRGGSLAREHKLTSLKSPGTHFSTLQEPTAEQKPRLRYECDHDRCGVCYAGESALDIHKNRFGH
ncbi:C2H2-type domain-containing protein [Mycena indigotica]|uniref:C2H2-type domain-containing protein n=1 Tax=Mycena indigotica TaxID=2126181 RepID=A0A8H6SM54_9AGAR|nr:C2H2-type domain-containing protein [Mycena indigotica]KAF7301864.1 C2H2-type domain-containing protein [Mycena indigotica]